MGVHWLTRESYTYAPVVGIEFTIERERRLVPVVETNCWELRPCFSYWEFQQDFRPESYADLSSCWIYVLQISAAEWNCVLCKRSLDQRSNFFRILCHQSAEIGAGWLGSDENRIFIDSRRPSSVVRFSVNDLSACEYLGPQSMWIRWPRHVRVTPTSRTVSQS